MGPPPHGGPALAANLRFLGGGEGFPFMVGAGDRIPTLSADFPELRGENFQFSLVAYAGEE